MVPSAVRCHACRSVVPADVLAAVGDACPNCHRPLTWVARHERAVAQTLKWADEAVARGRHADALAWLRTVEAIGDQLPDEYELKRGDWQRSRNRR
jgi:hypothetical protein